MPEKYSDILNRSWDDIPQPKLLPEGTWLLKLRNVSYFPANEESNQPERVAFFFEAKEPMDDVDAQELSALGDGYNYAINDITKQFSIFRPAAWNDVRKLLALLGVDTKGKDQATTFKDAKGAEVLGYLRQNTFQTRAGETRTDNVPEMFEKVA